MGEDRVRCSDKERVILSWTERVSSSPHPRQITITLQRMVPVHWSLGIQHVLWRSTVVAVVAPRSCAAPLSLWMRLCQKSCGHQGRGTMVYCMAGTHPLFCDPCAHHQLGPWNPACLEPGNDVREEFVSVCQWSSSCRLAQTEVHTQVDAPRRKPSYL